MRPPDFEIETSFRAGELSYRVPPDASTEAEEAGVERGGARRGLPSCPQPGRRYRQVDVEKTIAGRLAEEE